MIKKDLNQLRFKLKTVPCSDTIDSDSSQDFVVKINGTEYYTNNAHIRKVSKTISKLPSTTLLYTVDFPTIDQSFISLFFMALGGIKRVEVDISKLKWLAMMWQHFQVDGDAMLKNKTVNQELESALTGLLNPSSWKEILEFASQMNLPELKASCFKFLFQCEFSMLKDLKQSINIKEEDFQELLQFIHQKIQANSQSETKLTLLTINEVFQLIDTQYPIENGGVIAMQKKLELMDKYTRFSENKETNTNNPNISNTISLELIKIIGHWEEERKSMLQRISSLEEQLAIERARVSQLEAANEKLKYLEEAMSRTHCLVSRFPKVKDFGWKNENKIDGITFSVNKDIKIIGVGLYMPILEKVSGKLKFCEGVDCERGDVFVTDLVLHAEKGELLYPQVKKFEFPEPMKCQANKEYTCAIQLSGGETWWGISGQKVVAGEKGVIFTFTDSQNSSATNIASGQFPIIYYDA